MQNKEEGPKSRTLSSALELGLLPGVASRNTIDPNSRQGLDLILAELIINSTSDFMWCVNCKDFGLLTFNKSLSDYFLHERGIKIAVGMRPEDLFPPGKYVETWHGIYKKALAQGEFSEDYSVYSGTRYLQLSVNLIREKGEVVGISVFGKDDTKRKLIQDALRDNEEKFRIAFMTGTDAFYIGTLDDGRIVEVNTIFEDIFGYPRDEAIGKTSLELGLYANPSDRAKAIGLLKESGFVKDLEMSGRKKDGSLITVSLSMQIMVLKGIKHSLGVIRDITALKETEKALREAGNKYREIVEDAIEGIYRTTLDGHTLSANQALARMLGYDSVQEVLTSIVDWGTQVWFDPAERQSFLTLLRERKAIRGYECLFKKKNGDVIWVSLNSRMIFGEDGTALFAEGFAQEISDRKRAEDAGERIRASFEKGAVAQALTSLDGKFLRVNEALAKLLKYPAEKLEGMTFNEITHPEDRGASLNILKDLGKSGGTFRFEKRYITSKSEIVWVDINVALVRDSSGQPQYFVGTFVDITQRKHAEAERQRSEDQLKLTLESITSALSMAIEVRDPYTSGHQRRVADLACKIWEKLRLPKEAIEGLRIAALLHDLGKLRIPTDILSKPTKLSLAEVALIREHALAGWEILRFVEFPWPVATIVKQHHERLDGTGYPDGLKGVEILMESQVLAVSDVVEAMASHRPYRSSLGLDAALEEIKKGSGIYYSSEVVEAVIALFHQDGYMLP